MARKICQYSYPPSNLPHCLLAVLAIAALVSAAVAEVAETHNSGAVDAEIERCVKGQACASPLTASSSSLLQGRVTSAHNLKARKRATQPDGEPENVSASSLGATGLEDSAFDVNTFEATMEAFRSGHLNMTLCTPYASPLLMKSFRGITCGIAIGFAIATVVLHLVETFVGKQGWGLISMFVVGYLILIPGVFAPIFSLRMKLTEPLSQMSTEIFFDSQTCEPGILVESIWSVISLLFRSGSPAAGAIVGFYGIGVPALKLVLLLIGLALQRNGNAAHVTWARHCIEMFRFLSKWDAPKLACYSLLFFTMARLNWEGQLETDSNLESGFSCYLVYCMVTLFGALAVPLPSAVTHTTYQQSSALRKSHANALLVTSGCLCILFVGLMICGSILPMMSVHLDMSTSPKAQGLLASAAEAMDMSSWANRYMSFLECFQFLSRRSSGGDFNAAFAWILLACFVVALTAANMVVLFIAAFIIHRNATAGRSLPTLLALRSPKVYLETAHVLKYLSMLDVFILGSYIWVASTTGSFEIMGLSVALHRGVAYLLAAEMVHYCMYYVVTRTAKQITRKTGSETIALHGAQPVRGG